MEDKDMVIYIVNNMTADALAPPIVSDGRSQVISSHGIDLFLLEHTILSSQRLMFTLT